MNSIWLAALTSAVTVMTISYRLVPPRRRLGPRLRPYSGLARSRIGTGYADVSLVSIVKPDDRSTLARLFEPSIRSAASSLGNLIDATDDESLELRLRQADFVTHDVSQYRLRQLGFAVAGVAGGAAIGLAVLGGVLGTFFMMFAFGFPAATFQRSRVDRAITERCRVMRAEVYTVAQLLAVHLRTGRGPVESVRVVCSLGRGPVIEELREALSWMSSGTAPQDAYRRMAETTPEAAAARLYRLLGASSQVGGDIGSALLAVGDDLRSERRDELARAAVKRRTAMLAPLLLLIAPVMLLFVGAALPSMVLGPLK